MLSEKQLQANRRNAQRSTGPKTATGKQRASRNNLRHRLTGQTNILSEADRAAHDEFCEALIADLQPKTALEQQLANAIAEDNYRLNRLRAVETNMFALAHAPEADELESALAIAEFFRANTKQFDLLSIYEQRINRSIQRNLKLLNELQAERKAQIQSRPQSQSASANANGFEFSNATTTAAAAPGRHPESANHPRSAPHNPISQYQTAAAGA